MRHAFGLSLLALMLAAHSPAWSQQLTQSDAASPEDHAAVSAEDARAPASIDTGAPPEIMTPGSAAQAPVPASPLAAAVRQIMEAAPTGLNDRETEERAAISAFYAARNGAPLWLDGDRFNARAESLLNELAKAADWGLDPADFAPPQALGDTATPDTLAATETALTLAAIKYARYARGGRIMRPAQDLSSYLDRAPQLQSPKLTLATLAATEDAGTTLRTLHPQHPQFEKLRQKYLSLRGTPKPQALAKNQTVKSARKAPAVAANPFRALSPEAKRVLANMEQWRWMPENMGNLYVWNNIPEFTLRVHANGQQIHTERIVAGLLSKQTPIFSRPMRRIVFRPKWRIPESIKVREIWPSLMSKGSGGLMAQYGLRIETKEGEVVPTNSVNWSKADIRNYEIIQPPGPNAILGNIKFSFPNPHTVYMHDTQDKHLFAASQRTYSHGCMRVKNPAKLAEVLLTADKGYDAAKVDDLIKNGPLDNTVELTTRVPVHITYFTASVDDAGKLQTFRDPYGHERRIIQALEGRWTEIHKGRDHLAPVDPNEVIASQATRATRLAAKPEAAKPFNFIGNLFSSGF
ncbi:MAG: L,D-transpeptidase family protein [Hyphomicrobiaceae bacterium]